MPDKCMCTHTQTHTLSLLHILLDGTLSPCNRTYQYRSKEEFRDKPVVTRSLCTNYLDFMSLLTFGSYQAVTCTVIIQVWKRPFKVVGHPATLRHPAFPPGQLF